MITYYKKIDRKHTTTMKPDKYHNGKIYTITSLLDVEMLII